MTQNELLNSIITDLGANYQETDSQLLSDLVDEIVNNALFISNRTNKPKETSITLLQGEIRRAVKSIYLQRGAEDVKTQSISGLSSSYDDAMEKLRNDIIKNGKRLLK